MYSVLRLLRKLQRINKVCYPPEVLNRRGIFCVGKDVVGATILRTSIDIYYKEVGVRVTLRFEGG